MISSALTHARATSSRIGSPRIYHSLSYFRSINSTNTINVSLFNVRLYFLVNILKIIDRKYESSIYIGRNIVGDYYRVLAFNIDEGIGWNGSELDGSDEVDLSVLFLDLLKIGAITDILSSMSISYLSVLTWVTMCVSVKLNDI
jgi:hypothetical protein